MKIINKLCQGLVGARAGVLATILFTTALFLPAYTQSAYSAPIAQTKAIVTVPFNGKAVFDAAFAALRDNHYTLVEPAARAAFIAKWQHKHDNDDILSTELFTDMAIYEMVWSLGQRFDYYFPPPETTAEHEEEMASHVVKTDYQDSIAHISLSNFSSKSAVSEMAKALEAAGQNATGVILDLRGNPGGSLLQVIDLAMMFMSKGVILKQIERVGNHMVTTTYSVNGDTFIKTIKSDDGSPTQVNETERIPVLIPAAMPVLVLIDEDSASASEILAGTLQANGRARIMGQPSCGKGVGQTVIPLPTGRSMHITSFEFFPGGVKMDWVGIIPDIEEDPQDDSDGLDHNTTDTVLVAARLELINSAKGHPTPARPQAEVDASRAELEKLHKEEFQMEEQERQKLLNKADKLEALT
jgi:hypothetical protein